MPIHNASRSDQNERFPPPGPERSQRNPEQSVQGSQSTARSLRVQSQQLLTESQVFEDEVLPATESADHPPEEMSERRDHSKNLSGKARIELCAKSFICVCTTFWRSTRNRRCGIGPKPLVREPDLPRVGSSNSIQDGRCCFSQPRTTVSTSSSKGCGLEVLPTSSKNARWES
jgi:hypothetical protein